MRKPRGVLIGLAGACALAFPVVGPVSSASADVCHMSGSKPTFSNGASFTATAVGSCALTRVRAYLKCSLTGSSRFVGPWVKSAGAKSHTFCNSKATDWGYQAQSTSGGTVYSYSLR
jgi:hypothetical protein